MTRWSVSRLIIKISCLIGVEIGLTASVPAAEIQVQIQAVPPQSALSPTGKLLTIEDAVRIGVENHPRIKSASERIGSTQAQLGQQMGAYYPTVSFNNFYRSGTAGSTGVSNPFATDAYNSQANFNLTLYNFGKREGNVQAARETLAATKEDFATTIQDIILGIKQSYYNYLTAQAIVNVRKDTVRNRELLVRQARGFFEVGTR